MNQPDQQSCGVGQAKEIQRPEHINIVAACYEHSEMRDAVTFALEQTLHTQARLGMDLRFLDGVTVTHDIGVFAVTLQNVPEGQILLERGKLPETMDLGQTVPVRRDGEVRFHIVLRPGVGVMLVSPEEDLQSEAYGCVAHEASHVDHESHLYRTFPQVFACPVECGGRSRQTFLKALDVWAEYAACRSTAIYRPKASEDFEDSFCRLLERSFSACKEQIAAFRREGNASLVFRNVQQLCGDVFIAAGYLLGHGIGLEKKFEDHAPRAAALLGQHPPIERLFVRLQRILHELWLTEYAWESIEVFAPIYDLICDFMKRQGLVFARHETEWRIVMCEDDPTSSEIDDAMAKWMARTGRSETDLPEPRK